MIPQYHFAENWSNHLLAVSFCLSPCEGRTRRAGAVSGRHAGPAARGCVDAYRRATCGAIEQTQPLASLSITDAATAETKRRQAASAHRLLQHFDREQLFMDVDAIEPSIGEIAR